MIFIFLIILFVLNLLDRKFLENKYSAFINIFGGIFGLIFLFLNVDSNVELLNTVNFDKFIIVSYIAIKASYNLYNLINKKDNIPYKNWEFGALVLFSLNSLYLKGFILLLGFTPSIFHKKEDLVVSKIDLVGFLLTMLAILKFDFQSEIISLFLISILPIIVFIPLSKITKAKVLMLISYLVMANMIPLVFSLILAVFVFVFLVLESATIGMKELLFTRMKKIWIVEKMLTNANFKINKQKVLTPSIETTVESQRLVVTKNNNSFVDELYEIKFVGAFSCFLLLVIVLGLGFINGL